jgi:hypothetical protein
MATKAQPPPTTTQGGKVKHTIIGAMETLEGMQTMLGHTSLDLLKMDIEGGYEWPIFESWPELTDLEASSKVFLPMQVLVEIHYETQMADLRPKQRGLPWKTELELLELQSRLLKMGYVVVVRDDNRACDHCAELTLLRHKCF